MTQSREVNRAVTLGVMDVLLTLLALYAASWARYLIPWGARLPWRYVRLPAAVYAMAALIWPAVLALASAYEVRPHANARLARQLRSLAMGVGLAWMALAGTLYLSYRSVPRRLFFYFGVLDLLLLALARVVAQMATHRRGPDARLLIAGAGRLGQELAQQVQQEASGWRLVGFLDDDPDKVGRTIAGVPVLGPLTLARELVAREQVDEIIFAVPLRAYDRLVGLVMELEELPVEVSVIPDYFDLAFFQARMDEFVGFPLVRLRASAIEGRKRVAKRLLDLSVAVPSLILGLPVLLIIALAIRLDSRGAALFKQRRIGENGCSFTVWKFRTMVQNAEAQAQDVIRETEDGHILHKHPDDPRVTRVGRFLRRFSLDELPQLWNVVKGEMSLVGPRPELPWLVARYEGWQRKRLAVPPGITGWWQISGRSDRPMHLHVQDDLYYIHNYSIWLDLRILWRSVAVVLSGKGAY
jgi:exopolysaccharide biosynthesis polyprenyl glycosylphosphotransferase